MTAAALSTLCVEAAQDLALGLTYRIRHERLSLTEHRQLRGRIDALHQLARMLNNPTALRALVTTIPTSE